MQYIYIEKYRWQNMGCIPDDFPVIVPIPS